MRLNDWQAPSRGARLTCAPAHDPPPGCVETVGTVLTCSTTPSAGSPPPSDAHVDSCAPDPGELDAGLNLIGVVGDYDGDATPDS
jgi:hypothetical protein